MVAVKIVVPLWFALIITPVISADTKDITALLSMCHFAPSAEFIISILLVSPSFTVMYVSLSITSGRIGAWEISFILLLSTGWLNTGSLLISIGLFDIGLVLLSIGLSDIGLVLLSVGLFDIGLLCSEVCSFSSGWCVSLTSLLSVDSNYETFSLVEE